MKFSTLFLLLFFFTQVATSQSATKETMDSTYKDRVDIPVKYCLIIPSGKFLSKYIDIQIDYGQEQALFKNSYIRDEDGNKRTFNSIVHALNYMESLGWELVKTYSEQETENNFRSYFLFKSDGDATLPIHLETAR
ncbi:hypothetical protein [Zunongwangia sp. HGR-M22]|uniref:hypothetical protein n=1 Tax=Zunongwangia sp. HGR-M22 TaxID=3015168 RepID=UPI0022DD976B|nr:hypothetical protein [Zunongwangia sp. HGR-M22]WBL25052.1 hypothetical protein PBT91_14255 [Zunongwangia sp. HGR-M22]